MAFLKFLSLFARNVSLMKKNQKIKAVPALPKTGFHSAGLAKLARTIGGMPGIGFAQTVAILRPVFGRCHTEWGFIPAGFLTANRLRPGGEGILSVQVAVIGIARFGYLGELALGVGVAHVVHQAEGGGLVWVVVAGQAAAAQVADVAQQVGVGM
jgi:hypothetical protein